MPATPQIFPWTTLGAISFAVACLASAASAKDWPTWRHDAARSARTSPMAADSMSLLWVRQFPKLKPAYRNKRLQFDAGYEPIVAGKTMFVASSQNDSLTALDIETGEQRWRFYTDGPVRLAPVAWRDRVFLGSDDGHLYCLAAEDGRLLWKFRAVPSVRKILGNGRLISVWPIRGGPAVQDGRIYFAAGVWPFEGVFVYSLEAETGQVVWLNDDCGYLYGLQPHGGESLGGLTPQGYLVVNGDELIVPCGQALPARFDLQSGRFLSFQAPEARRMPGSWFASSDVRRGEVVLDADMNRELHEDKIDQGPGEPDVRTTIHLGEQPLRFGDGFPGVEGPIHTMLAADEKLFVVTLDGTIHCFGPQAPAAVARHPLETQALPAEFDGPSSLVKQTLEVVNARRGYSLVLGIDDVGLLKAFVEKTKLQVIAVDADGAKVDRLRRQFDAAGIRRDRVSFHVGAPGGIQFPPYMASLAVINDAKWLADADDEMGITGLDILRPYGGAAVVNLSDDDHARLVAASLIDEGFTIERTAEVTIVRRPGPLPGAANYRGDWTSSDERVKSPFGLLWFDDTLTNFKRSPQPTFVDGVMISHSKDWMARHREGKATPYLLLPPVLSDVYTGRVLASDERPIDVPEHDPQAVQPSHYHSPSQPTSEKRGQAVAGDRVNPLTGKTEPRTFLKSYGCEGGVDYGHLITMRSGTAAFYDKRLESGTCSISGTRSGCTNSVIPACGLLNVPYFFEGCTCSYPLPSGLALTPMPADFEQWAAWGSGEVTNIERLGVNLGAPGDRMTEAGTLWLDYPSRGGPSPEVDVQVEPATAEFYYAHSLWIEGGTGWPWVAASGVRGASVITISGLRPGAFTVRLFFADADHEKPTARRFDIALNGAVVAKNFDVAQAAGGRMRGVVREFEDVEINGSLKIDLNARRDKPILSGIEIVAQER